MDFRVWAPSARRVVLHSGTRQIPMTADDQWWTAEDPHAGHGTDYGFSLDGADQVLPDPRSRRQPEGVHGRSRVYDHDRYTWGDGAWTGRQLAGSVIYELHVGTFTPSGTFDGAIERLPYLRDLGVDLIELLPVNTFNGEHNWGYDGVGWHAVQESYGGPDGLKRFVDAAHQAGIGVIIDAVYNHFGPSGAYTPQFGPYLSQGANTWGRSLNLDEADSGEVRRFIIDSALQWLRDYHCDGLRLDAVHALVDRGATHLLEALAVEVDALSAAVGRPLTLIAESDLNDARLITAREAGGYGLQAQWDDDVHHALHAMLTGERQGYYGDFGSAECFKTVWEQAFYHAGTWSTFRRRIHGRPVDRSRIPGYRFVVCLQNHDQIGNRAVGDRLTATLSPGLLRVGATLLLTSPFTPMLFMGEEFGARTPWQFFTSHPEPELAAAVGKGRREEFAEHGWSSEEVPDPQDPETFSRSHLDWAAQDPDLLQLYRRLIALRKTHEGLADPRLDQVHVVHDDGVLLIRRGDRTVVANLTQHPRTIPLGADCFLFTTDEAAVVQSDSLTLPAESAAIL
ncbi:malto-oligosyltrehalose trehalohydrolase [Dactylosporangium matsuzakiense]|uniref:Malto-oligosyltrehalose trehalohydrolase n=1 Tax=Dactylosporangium matsuzakiense TaxID=53360 RepID=A0A9W6NJ83_9ACTN|nr:malto-oligosyltrehalose trehalohydrolase [Dactylosporangium matsuzakiense]UWZ42034.1 malto-oligosyltrehalose trehalohydrolase [Dactylosporangium matsuzakiense]GLK99649.1 malto-oligosyltrehalose trehalohydrolase [Dactylosporangium matsuzakiense]